MENEILNQVFKGPFHTNEAQLLPLLIKPTSESVNLREWLNANRSSFEADLVNYGGVLFRGFSVKSVNDFNDFMKCFNTDPLPYMFRSSPRRELDKNIKNIYRSTYYPSERSINMHNESSYSRVWGRKIVFCCIQPAEEGGETPIADSRSVLRDIDADLVEKFRKLGVRYRRNLLPDLGMPWQEVFQTEDKSVAVDICNANKIRYEFLEDGGMKIEWDKPAVYTHPVSGARTWFNHVMFFHKYSRYEEMGLPPEEELDEEYLTSETFFGDGSAITFEEYSEIKDAYRKNIIAFPYCQGDILFLDNMLAAHGRNPYKGERTIATAIIEATYDSDHTA